MVRGGCSGGTWTPRPSAQGGVPLASLCVSARIEGGGAWLAARSYNDDNTWLVVCWWEGGRAGGLKRGVVAREAQQIFRTRAESQRIVATRPLCRVQYPVPYSSRLQGIHRAGSGNCDRSRLMRYGCTWLPPRGGPLSFRHGF
jgi:hypothetical protein